MKTIECRHCGALLGVVPQGVQRNVGRALCEYCAPVRAIADAWAATQRAMEERAMDPYEARAMARESKEYFKLMEYKAPSELNHRSVINLFARIEDIVRRNRRIITGRHCRAQRVRSSDLILSPSRAQRLARLLVDHADEVEQALSNSEKASGYGGGMKKFCAECTTGDGSVHVREEFATLAEARAWCQLADHADEVDEALSNT